MDYSPNSEARRVDVYDKSELFRIYEEKFGNENNAMATVSYAKFCEMWNYIFPKYHTADFCNIPGKCWVCYEIDCLRQSTDDSVVLKKCQEAHQLHRGGMFALERGE